jgi:hypothetical protein
VIDNTTERLRGTKTADAILIDARHGGSWGPNSIEQMERDGQQQLVSSDRLPVDTHRTDAEFEALGFTFGDPDPGDPIFRPATLPEGWRREGSDHAMWSHLVDGLGRKRAGVFYKAAFYDRSAHMRLDSLAHYVTCAVEYDEGPVIFDDEWASKEAVGVVMSAIIEGNLKEAAQFEEFAADTASGRRDEQNRAHCAEIAATRTAAADRYRAALAALMAGADTVPE